MFAYGSLMGDNALAGLRTCPARLAGFHRAFNHQSQLRWGRPEQPCPILGLSPGGECWGLAFDVPPEREKTLLKMLDRRESADERRRVPVELSTPEGGATAWASISRPEYARNGGPPDLDALERSLRAAHGVVGTGAEYVRTLAHALQAHALGDPLVDELWRRLRR